jgi:hypothetical protein
MDCLQAITTQKNDCPNAPLNKISTMFHVITAHHPYKKKPGIAPGFFKFGSII